MIAKMQGPSLRRLVLFTSFISISTQSCALSSPAMVESRSIDACCHDRLGGWISNVETALAFLHSHSQWWNILMLLMTIGFYIARRHDAHQLARIGLSSPTSLQSNASADQDDPKLLRDHSSFEDFTTSYAHYSNIRTFFHPHPQASKLPQKPEPLPVLVFIHGLGGSLAQFTPLLAGLTNVAPCFGIDLPGCGRSKFSPRDWEPYSHLALVELLDKALDRACQLAGTHEVVLVCHSMGCSLAVSLLAGGHKLKSAAFVNGLIAICPKASTPTISQIKSFRHLLSIPTPVFELFRAWDRRGGIGSTSVARFVGDSASIETKKLQLRFNEESKTDVWRRMAWGALPAIHPGESVSGGMPGPDIWGEISVPLLVIAGEADHVTKPEEVTHISKAIAQVKARSLGNGAAFKSIILPSPAGHGLLYDHATYRTVSGVILTFLSDHIQERLSMGWQLQYLKESNKWDVKNLAKWEAVVPVSECIGNVFRAMKTLRENDAVHSPNMVVENWRNQIKAVVDISRDSPIYNPHDLEKGGIEYHKFPTVSKIPPTTEEVRGFVALIDQLRLEEKASASDRAIGVHCHYGFNRTGFFICSYLIEREGYAVQRAVDEFAKQRPPGIRHEHFLDTLFVRYSVGLRRSQTM